MSYYSPHGFTNFQKRKKKEPAWALHDMVSPILKQESQHPNNLTLQKLSKILAVLGWIYNPGCSFSHEHEFICQFLCFMCKTFSHYGFTSNSHKKSWTVSYFRVSCCPAKSSSSNNGMGQVLISTTASGDHDMVNRVNGTTRNLSGVSSRNLNSETGVNETIVWKTIMSYFT